MSTVGRKVNARIVEEAVSVSTGGREITASIVGRECTNRGKTNVNINVNINAVGNLSL